jgi:multiple sugar transport system permease protein
VTANTGAVGTVAPTTTASARGPRLDREARWGLIFISPWLVGFLLFMALPMLAALYLSFTDYNPIDPGATEFIGLENYRRMLRDPVFLESLWVTIKFAVLVVPATLLFALGVALLVNSTLLRGRALFRTLFYMPVQIPLVASTLVWMGMLNSQSGWINLGLSAAGLPVPDWLHSTFWVYPSLTLMGLWGIGNMMLIFLAGLQGVPTELYEAARVDGAGRWATFRHVTVPMISTVLFYNLIIVLIGTFQYFTQAYVITNGRGDPDGATLFFNLNLFREGFVYFDMGYASALAWVLFAIVLALTALLFRYARTWVYEGSGAR